MTHVRIDRLGVEIAVTIILIGANGVAHRDQVTVRFSDLASNFSLSPSRRGENRAMEFFRYYRTFVLAASRMSSLEISGGSFCLIPVIRYRRRHEMKCQKESVKKLTQKSI
jgi:hypothetical protein